MTLLKRMVSILVLLAATAGGDVLLAQGQTTQPKQQEEYVPIDQLPPQDQLPAAPLLIGAYAVVLVALFGYLFSVARRLNTVQREVERLEGDMKRGARG